MEENPEAEVRDVFDLLQGYENVKNGIGYMDEGQEIETCLGKDEKPYLKDDEETLSDDESGAGDDDEDDDDKGGNGVPPRENAKDEQRICLQMPQRDEQEGERDDISKEEEKEPEDPVESDLCHVKVMISLSKGMNDKSIRYWLLRRRDALLRVRRHGDSHDRKSGLTFLQMQEKVYEKREVLGVWKIKRRML